MPKYAALIYSPAEDEAKQPPAEVTQRVVGEYMEFGQDAEAVLAGGETLHPSAAATTITVAGGKGGEATFTDGPFAETKEVLGGFCLIEAADLDEALGWAQQIPGPWYGKVEVRPVMEFSDTGELIA